MPEEMPPLTTPDRPLNPRVWRVMLLLACVLVFAFALHAKLGMYVAGSQPDASTASKLWTDAAKWQPPPINPSAALMWLAVFVASLLRTELVVAQIALDCHCERSEAISARSHEIASACCACLAMTN